MGEKRGEVWIGVLGRSMRFGIYGLVELDLPLRVGEWILRRCFGLILPHGFIHNFTIHLVEGFHDADFAAVDALDFAVEFEEVIDGEEVLFFVGGELEEGGGEVDKEDRFFGQVQGGVGEFLQLVLIPIGGTE